MPIIPEVLSTLDKLSSLHKSKNDDYAPEGNAFFNFDVQEYFSSLFTNSRDKVFTVMLAVKLARLSTLLNKKSNPNNESIEDSFDDAAMYMILWKADYVRRSSKSRNANLAEKVANG